MPVVALTAFAMAEDRDRALLDGFDGYLSKPISVRDLPHQVASFCAEGATMTEPITILAVDDQPANLRLLDAVLSPRGYRVVTRNLRRAGARAAALVGCRPGAPRHSHARYRRVRGVPTDPQRA